MLRYTNEEHLMMSNVELRKRAACRRIFENMLEYLKNNNNYPKNQQICNGTLNMISIIQSFNKYPFSLVCLFVSPGSGRAVRE
jgi:hypothetical protein